VSNGRITDELFESIWKEVVLIWTRYYPRENHEKPQSGQPVSQLKFECTSSILVQAYSISDQFYPSTTQIKLAIPTQTWPNPFSKPYTNTTPFLHLVRPWHTSTVRQPLQSTHRCCTD
jgi:hypothetical protein